MTESMDIYDSRELTTPPPCEDHPDGGRCKYYKLCEAHKMSCYLFYLYVTKKKETQPTFTITKKGNIRKNRYYLTGQEAKIPSKDLFKKT